EARELYHQQLIQLQQQQQQQQQQQRSESVSGRRQKRIDSKHSMSTETAATDLSSEMRSKASFAIGVDEDEDEDDIDSDVSSVANGSTTLNLVEAHQRAASSGKSLSPSHMLTPDSLDGSCCSKPVKPSTSPVLPRRTFPSAPYLPLYNKPSTGTLKSPIPASTKLIMNPNPNSSSAADIPMLNATHAEKQPNDTQTDADLMHALSVKSNGSSTGKAPKPIPFSKTGSSGNGTVIPSNVDCETRLKHLPPEQQAPLHQTPPTGTVATDADIAAAAAAARARGTNVPRSVSEFHRRLSDLRNHHVQQLNALALQIDLLKRGAADSAQTCEYYEREIVKVAEGARREEGWLLEYGRRAMGIDVNTLKRMLTSLNSFDMHRFLAGVHGSSDPAIRKTKSTTHIPGQQQYDQQVPSIQQLQQQQLQQQHIQQQQQVQQQQQQQHHQQQALSEQLIHSGATIPQRTRSHARVMDLLAIRELDSSGQVMSVVENAAAANTDAGSTEFVQMQYDAQVLHLKNAAEKRASETRRPESVHNAACEVSERSSSGGGGGSVAVYSSVRGNPCGILDKPIVFEDESGSFDAGVEDIDSCCGTVHGDCEEDRIVDGMDRGLESSGEVSLVASEPSGALTQTNGIHSQEEESLSADAQATQALQATTPPTYQASRMATSNVLHALFSLWLRCQTGSERGSTGHVSFGRVTELGFAFAV
ncbi:hypothetical protein CcCBS67573_g09703, partial [Chytriomyces confervae]